MKGGGGWRMDRRECWESLNGWVKVIGKWACLCVLSRKYRMCWTVAGAVNKDDEILGRRSWGGNSRDLHWSSRTRVLLLLLTWVNDISNIITQRVNFKRLGQLNEPFYILFSYILFYGRFYNRSTDVLRTFYGRSTGVLCAFYGRSTDVFTTVLRAFYGRSRDVFMIVLRAFYGPSTGVPRAFYGRFYDRSTGVFIANVFLTFYKYKGWQQYGVELLMMIMLAHFILALLCPTPYPHPTYYTLSISIHKMYKHHTSIAG